LLLRFKGFLARPLLALGDVVFFLLAAFLRGAAVLELCATADAEALFADFALASFVRLALSCLETRINVSILSW
jgi:hypothetical protein